MDLTNTGAFSGTNLENARDHNRRVAIETLRVHGPLSRADVARITGLSVQTTSNIAEELIRASLLLESPVSTGLRGKPPKLLVINPDGAFSIGLQLDHNWLIGVLLDLTGVRRGKIVVPVDSPTPKAGLAALEKAAGKLVADANVRHEQICGIGVVMPGPFEVDSIADSGPTVLPGWADVAVADRLAERLNLPVWLENDATAAAMGEHYFGVARQHREIVVIFVGTGLGGGILINGQPYEGAFGNAGEIGHLTVYPNGRHCYCGNQGCAETYLSVHAAYEYLGYAKTPPTYDELLHRFHTRDPQFDRWMDEAATVLRLLVVNLENLLDPETVIVNGFMPHAILAELKRRALPLPASVSSRRRREVPRLILGAAGQEVAALGAAVLPLFYSFGHLTPVSAALPVNT